MTTEQTRQAIARAAAILMENPRDGWRCWAGSTHTDGPCKACQRAEARRLAAEAVTS
jgi:hypothetical protein